MDISRIYGVDLRTVDRWHCEKFLPRPRYTPGGHPYWTAAQLKRAESVVITSKKKVTAKAIRRAGWLHRKRTLAKQEPVRQFGLPLQFNFPVTRAGT